MLKAKAPYMLNSTVEIDETYVGGLSKHKHKNEREKIIAGRGYTNKTMVFAILDRKDGVWTKMVDKVDGEYLKPIIRERIDKSTRIITDGFGAYYGLDKEYKHEIINHQQDEWYRDGWHTNSIEGFFSQLKRGIFGIYHHVSPKHLQRYCDEFSFRYNTRKANEDGRFNYSFVNVERRLKYKELIKNV